MPNALHIGIGLTTSSTCERIEQAFAPRAFKCANFQGAVSLRRVHVQRTDLSEVPRLGWVG